MESLPERTEPLYETERTRVSRLVFPTGTVIRKEPLGPDAPRRLRHEVEILERLSGLDGVAQLSPEPPPCPGSILLVDVGGAALSERATPLDPAQLADLGLALARAVAGMHRRGVLHRDVNPANIVVNARGDALNLIDFTLATTVAAFQPEFAHHNAAVGTVPYLAPEQTGRTGRPVDQRADLYAVGATLYELATGAPPFGTGDLLRIIHDHLARTPASPSAVSPAVPADLSKIIMHLLEKELVLDWRGFEPSRKRPDRLREHGRLLLEERDTNHGRRVRRPRRRSSSWRWSSGTVPGCPTHPPSSAATVSTSQFGMLTRLSFSTPCPSTTSASRL